MSDLKEVVEKLKNGAGELTRLQKQSTTLLHQIVKNLKVEDIPIELVDTEPFMVKDGTEYYLAIKDGALSIYVFSKSKNIGAYGVFHFVDPVEMLGAVSRLPRFLSYLLSKVETRVSLYNEAVKMLEQILRAIQPSEQSPASK